MSSRRLDINFLLCSDDHPPQPQPRISYSTRSPVAEPVILAPHLRNPHARPATHLVFTDESDNRVPLLSQPVNVNRATPSPTSVPDIGTRQGDNQPADTRPFQQLVTPHEQRRPALGSPLHQPSQRSRQLPPTEYPYQSNSHSSSSSRAPSHSPAVSYSYAGQPSRPSSFSPTSSYTTYERITSPTLSVQHRRPGTPTTLYQPTQLPPSSFPQSPSSLSQPFQSRPTSSRLKTASNSVPASNPFGSYPSPSSSTKHSLPSPHPASPVQVKRSYVGLEALVHAASEERRRLSGGTTSPVSSPDTYASTTPVMESSLPRSNAPGLRRSPGDHMRGDFSPAAEDPRQRTALPHYQLQERAPGDKTEVGDRHARSSAHTRHRVHDMGEEPVQQPSWSGSSRNTMEHRPVHTSHHPAEDAGKSSKRRLSDQSAETSHEFTRQVRSDVRPRSHSPYREPSGGHDTPIEDVNQKFISVQHQPYHSRAPSDEVNLRRRRRASSPNHTPDAPLKKKKRWSGSHSGTESVNVSAESRLHPPPEPPFRNSSIVSRPEDTLGNSAGTHRPTKASPVHEGEFVPVRSDRSHGVPADEPRGELVNPSEETVIDKLKEEEPRRETLPFMETTNGATLQDAPRSQLDDTNAVKASHEQDPHEWLLEHYSDSPPRHAGQLQSSSTHPTQSRASSEPQSAGSPTQMIADAVAVEQSTSGAASPGKTETDDIDFVSELVAETLDGAETHPVSMEVDVEDELLSLVDVKSSNSPPSRKPRLSPSPLLQSNAPTHVPPSANDNEAPVPVTASLSTVQDGIAPSHTPVPTPTSERGSMPPPTASKKEERDGNVAGVKKKKKEGPAKAPAKSKPPPKPRVKPVPKPKAKNATHGSVAVTTGKGAKGSSTVLSGVKKSVSAGSLRSRSTSVMPLGSVGPEGEAKADPEDVEVDADGDDQDNDDGKLYCICSTRYDEDRVMIACDRCDEWFHTQCVNIPDLEVDLVDQFICPPCIEKHPELSLNTTYKRRCLFGLNHLNPASPSACHKPVRGVFSKYCSDECGVKYMQSRIDAWVKKGGKREKLWESVKNVDKREGFVVCAEEEDGDAKVVKTEPGDETSVKVSAVIAKPKQNKVEREIQPLNPKLDQVVLLREQMKKDMEVIVWRQRLLELAMERAENMGQCGWDQRLCFGDEEWADFGAEVLESYENLGRMKPESGVIHADGEGEGDGEWWCSGKKHCQRHAGWEDLRSKDVKLEKETKELSLHRLTSQEREIRKRIEDIMDRDRDHNDAPKVLEKHSKSIPFNGELMKRAKKRKNQ